jgi:hypothetical protein
MTPNLPGESGRRLRRRWGVLKNRSPDTAYDVAGPHDTSMDDPPMEPAQPELPVEVAVDERERVVAEVGQELPAPRCAA